MLNSVKREATLVSWASGSYAGPTIYNNDGVVRDCDALVLCKRGLQKWAFSLGYLLDFFKSKLFYLGFCITNWSFTTRTRCARFSTMTTTLHHINWSCVRRLLSTSSWITCQKSAKQAVNCCQSRRLKTWENSTRRLVFTFQCRLWIRSWSGIWSEFKAPFFRRSFSRSTFIRLWFVEHSIRLQWRQHLQFVFRQWVDFQLATTSMFRF